jgi:hypothetical protein
MGQKATKDGKKDDVGKKVNAKPNPNSSSQGSKSFPNGNGLFLKIYAEPSPNRAGARNCHKTTPGTNQL